MIPSCLVYWLLMMRRSGLAWFRCSSDDERSLELPRIIKVLNQTSVARLRADFLLLQDDAVPIDALASKSLAEEARDRIFAQYTIEEPRTISFYARKKPITTTQEDTRFVAIIELCTAQSSETYRIPDYIDWLPPRLAGQCTSPEKSTNFLDTFQQHPPPPPFYAESFSKRSPLFSYSTLCPDQCYHATLSDHDCRFCKKENTKKAQSTSTAESTYQGGGTKFASLRDITIFPDPGHALLFGGRLLHTQEPTVNGNRIYLHLLFDDGFCLQADADLNAFLLSIVLIALLLTFPIILYIVDYDDSPSPSRKVNSSKTTKKVS